MALGCASIWSNLVGRSGAAIPSIVSPALSAARSEIVVRGGDSVTALSRAHDFDVRNAQINRNNQVYDLGPGGIDPDRIQPGDRIRANDNSITSPADQVARTADQQGSAADVGGDREICCPPPDWMPFPWTKKAKNITEKGHGNHPEIMKYHGMAKYGAASERISWCGSFVAWTLTQAGHDLSSVPERALTSGCSASHSEGWWSTGENIGRPISGAIAMKGRTGGGHVTFVVGRDPDNPNSIHCLGGNQSDALWFSKYKVSDFHAFMVPEGYPHAYCELPDYTGKAYAAGKES